MSRIGKLPVNLPQGITVKVDASETSENVFKLWSKFLNRSLHRLQKTGRVGKSAACRRAPPCLSYPI